MPENTQFKAPDASKINWLYVGGGIFGLIAIIALMSRKSSTTGTVAAGTSINAALGSIQEQNLNLQGAQSFTQASVSKLQESQNASFSGMNDALNTGFGSVQTGLSDLGTTVQTGNSGITDLINTDVSGINTQLGTILGQESTTYSYLLNTRQAMEAAFGANSDQVKALDAEIQAVSAEMARGFSDLGAKLTSVPNPVSASSGGGGGGVVHTYVVNLPGGGQIHTNSTSAAGALNNVPGGHF